MSYNIRFYLIEGSNENIGPWECRGRAIALQVAPKPGTKSCRRQEFIIIFAYMLFSEHNIYELDRPILEYKL